MKRSAGERLMNVNHGCIGLDKKVKSIEEIFLIRQFRCRGCNENSIECYCKENPEKCYCKETSAKCYCNKEDKLKFMRALKECKYKNILIDMEHSILFEYKTREDLAKILFSKFYKLLEDNNITTQHQIENNKYYKLRIEHYFRITNQTKCPCCYYTGWTGSRGITGPIGPGGSEDYWNIQEFLDTL